MSGVAEAALAQVGVPFRLHGRDRAGLDCVGVVACALRAGGFEGDVPCGYALRGGQPDRVIATLDAALRRSERPCAGDVILFAVGPGQLHLAIRVEGGIVHADAGMRRVVMRPGGAPWPVLGVWRWAQ